MVSDPAVGTSGRFDSFFLKCIFRRYGKAPKKFVYHSSPARQQRNIVQLCTNNSPHSTQPIISTTPIPIIPQLLESPYLSYSTIHTLFYFRDVESTLSDVISTLSWIEKKRKLSTCVSWPQIVGSSPAASFSWSISTQPPRVSASSSRTSRCHNNHYILVILIAFIVVIIIFVVVGTIIIILVLRVPNVSKCEWNVTIYSQHTGPVLQSVFSHKASHIHILCVVGRW